MSNFSGLSAILTVSLVALVTIQMLKDKFQVIENYGETDEHNQYMNSFTYGPDSAQNTNEVLRNVPVLNNLNLPHVEQPFGTGEAFRAPYISENANQWNATPDAYSVFQQEISSATPNRDQLNNISGSSNLPGPNAFMSDSFVSVPNANMGREKNLSLCAQNFGLGVSANNVASSLLPSPATQGQLEGFSDCDITNSLSTQAFLTQYGGFNTTSGSLRNGNQDIRSLIPNPILNVGPWMNSTIYPDLLRRPLESSPPSFGVYGNGPYSAAVPVAINP